MNFAKAVNLAMRNGFAKFAKWVVNFAMRNFARLRQMNSVLALRNWHLALRTAQYPADTVPLVLHPAAHILSSTASHFLHFSFDFPLIFGLVDG